MKFIAWLRTAVAVVAASSGCAGPSVSVPKSEIFALASWGNGAPSLQLTLVKGFRMRRLEGPDFEVFYFRNAERKTSMGIYVGHNPNIRTEDLGADDITRAAGQVGHVPVEWRRWQKNGVQHSEALVEDFYGHSQQTITHGFAGLLLHVFVQAPTSDQISVLEEAAGSLRLNRR